jgi:hypothetical protein
MCPALGMDAPPVTWRDPAQGGSAPHGASVASRAVMEPDQLLAAARVRIPNLKLGLQVQPATCIAQPTYESNESLLLRKLYLFPGYV